MLLHKVDSIEKKSQKNEEWEFLKTFERISFKKSVLACIITKCATYTYTKEGQNWIEIVVSRYNAAVQFQAFIKLE